MAEERKHIINIHTATGVSEPSGASLYLGEIAVQHTPEDPALWIKVGTSEESNVYEKFIGKTEIMNIMNTSNILGSGYTYSGLPYVNSATTIADAYSALTNELIKDEYTISAAFNDVNDRLTALSGAMPDIDLEPLSASVVTNKTDIATLSGIVADDEVVTSAALNDLNARIIEVSAATADIPDVSGLETRLTNVETRVSGLSGDNLFIEGYEVASGSSEQELTLTSGDTISGAFGKIQKQMLDNEETIAASLNDLNSRINTLSGETTDLSEVYEAISGVSGSVSVLSAIMIDNEEIVAASLNDLNDRIIAVSGDVASVVGEVSGVLTINLNGEEKGKYSPSGDTTINLSALTEVTGADVLLTGYEISSGTTEEELVIRATDTVNEAFGKLQKQNYDNEEVVSGAFNDLDGRVIEMSGALATKQDVLVAGEGITISGNVISAQDSSASAITELSGTVVDLSSAVTILSGVIEDDELVISAALNNLNGRVTSVSGNLNTNFYTKTEVDNLIGSSSDFHYEIYPSTGSVTTPGANVLYLIGPTGTGSDKYEEYVYANSTWTKIGDTSIDLAGYATTGNVSSLSAATTGINSTLASHTGNSDIHVTTAQTAAWNGKQSPINDLETIRNNASSGANAYTNMLTGVSMNGNNVSVTNKVATLGTVVTAQTPLSTTATGAGNVVTDITVNDHQITKNFGMTIPSWATASTKPSYTASEVGVPAWATASTKPTYTASEVGALPTGTTLDNVADGTTRKLSDYATQADFTAHTASTTVHVSTTEKNTWSGKQDAISDLSTIRNNASSGASAYTGVTALSAATTAHTGNSDIHVTTAEKATWNGKANTSDITITGLTVGGTNATVTNKVAAVPTASTSTFGVVKIPAQATSFLTNTSGTIGVATGTGTNQVAKGSDFAAVSAATTAHTNNSAIHVPTGGTNGQVLMIVNGTPTWTTPVSIYTGSGTPAQSLGNDGDIYLQTS